MKRKEEKEKLRKEKMKEEARRWRMCRNVHCRTGPSPLANSRHYNFNPQLAGFNLNLQWDQHQRLITVLSASACNYQLLTV